MTSILIEVGIKLLGMFLDWRKVDREVKKDFEKFVSAWQTKKSASAQHRDDVERQLKD